MVTKKVIDEIYKRCHKRPASVDELDIALLFNGVAETHKLSVDEDWLTIGSMPDGSIFRRIALKRIHGILDFEDVVAIVLCSSIIFLDKNDSRSFVNLKAEKPSFLDKLRFKVSDECDE